ncbi:PucR family transcriptional regulator [Dorea formicigenerans]|uniref:PucR family transcriptional regulator n=1 Tax=Dorea formicigenerans TaxID=39486 RepID=UPI001D007430|nr:helix-turn-helix domain-containing protein [Dorea formicigenerans]MCB5500176.1 helix-turn-helix domain-containing protein [Dorea formicigenerans]
MGSQCCAKCCKRRYIACFDHEQSLSRTSEYLYLHKNTLQYKLDRIHKICGLNPRSFRDGVILYLALRLKEM